ncbi:RNA polymerase sigma factor [Amycolatopsis sp. NPDC003861]
MTEAEIFDHCRTSVRAFLRPRVPNTSDLDDCVSEVVVRALEGLRKGARPDVLEAWLIGIAKNVLKERYRAAKEDELPGELAQEPGEPQLELARTDLPDLPSEFEVLLGKRQLWDTLDAATRGLGDGLAAIMHAHLRLTKERGRHVVGAELARELGRPVDVVNRQLQRSRLRMLDAIAALVLARTGRADCAGLCEVLDADQLRAGRRLLLDPERTRAVLKHAGGCATCSPRVDEAQDYSRWALGPGLLRLADDEEERRRALVALLDRLGEGGISSAPAQAAALAVPVPLAGPANLAGRLLASRPALLRKVDGVTRFARDNPDVAHRIVAAATGGLAAAAAIVAAVLSGSDGGGVPPVAASPRAPGTTAPAVAVPTVSAPAAVPVALTAPKSTPPPTTTSPESPEPPAPGSSAVRPAVALPPPTTAAPPTSTATVPPTTAPPTTSNPPTTIPPTTAPPTTTPPPTTTTPHPQPITIDATGLSYTTITISGVGVRDSRQAQTLNLTPGPHTLATPAGQVLPFVVTDDYRVRYDQAPGGPLDGYGSSTLTVRGHEIAFDVSDVDYYTMAVSGTGFPAPQPVRHLRLLPGAHSVVTANGNSLPFTVTATGGITFPAGSPGLLTWDDRTLAVHGLPVTLDATGVDYANLTVSGAGWPAPQAIRTFRLLPGTHSVVTANGNSVPFTITTAGTVTYADALGVLFSTADEGRKLRVHGFRVTLDATDVDYDTTTVSGTGWRTPQAVRELRLLPGAHRVVAHDGLTAPFTVTATGLVRSDSPLLTGTGTVLAVHGLPVTLDVTDLGYANASIEGVAYGPPRPARTLRIFPGPHRVVTNGGPTLAFTVDEYGFVGYDPVVRGLLTAEGSTLAVHGFPVTVDATGSGHPQFGVEGVGWWDARQPRVVRLLPGTHYVTAPGGRRFAFTVTSAGRVAYAAALDGVFAGRDGTTLTLRPPG